MAQKKFHSATDQRPFVLIYQDFLESDLLDNYYQKLIYIYLKKFADSNNQCFPSVKKLSSLTKIGITKVKQTLAELEEKGVISKVNRSRSDGGKTSNLYVLYDFAEIWKVESSENVAAVAEEVSEARMIAALKLKGYSITKEKEPDTLPTDQSSNVSSTKSKELTNKNYITNAGESQEIERYTLEEIRMIYGYEIMINDRPHQKREIDSVMSILHTSLNTTKQTIRIGGDSKPAMVVISKLMKLDHLDIMYAIDKYQEQTDRINNPSAYMLTLLYNAKEQSTLDSYNKVQHDMFDTPHS